MKLTGTIWRDRRHWIKISRYSAIQSLVNSFDFKRNAKVVRENDSLSSSGDGLTLASIFFSFLLTMLRINIISEDLYLSTYFCALIEWVRISIVSLFNGCFLSKEP